MKILRVRRQKKENKIYESRVFVSIFLTSLDPPRKYDKLVKTQLNTSPDKSLQVYQVSSKIECVHYFKLNKNILLYMKYINTIIPTYMHTHTHTHAHTRTHTHTHTHTHAHTHTHTHTHAHTRTHTHTHTHTHAHTHTHTRAHTHARAHARTHTHTHKHIYIYIYIYTYLFIYLFIYLSYMWKSIQRCELSNIISLHKIHM